MVHRPHFDAGHGGSDPGAVGLVHEDDTNLAITLKCVAAAKRQGWDPFTTRTTDRTILLADRAKKANAEGADVFVSVHSDWSKGFDGMAAITPTNHDTKASWRLGDFILDELDPITAARDDVKLYTDRRGLAVLRGTGMPATIVEVLRVSDAKLKDPVFQTEVAEGIIQGLCRFYGVEYVQPGKPRPPKPKPHKKLPVLSAGDTGHYVKIVQRVVGVDDDGVYGPVTKKAVITFQKKHGLDADGIVGPATWPVILDHR